VNNYKAQSQKYQIFVCSEMINVNINKINIPKLNLQLEYSISRKMYVLNTRYYVRISKFSILLEIKNKTEKGLKPLWYEINHFTIEDNLISLIKSKDELNQRLASEILLLKLNKIKL
jgi:hypothetical protein